MTGFIQDIRYALRALKRAPGFAAVSILTLALGIAATTIVYSIVDGILLRPLPIDDPDRVMLAQRNVAERQRHGPVVAELSRLDGAPDLVRNVRRLARPDREPDRHRAAAAPQRAAGHVESAVGAGRQGRRSAATSPPATTSGAWSGPRLSATPSGSASSAARPTAIGRRIMLDESPVTVIGVLPQGFTVAREEDIFLPLGTFLDPNNVRGHAGAAITSNLAAIGRLEHGVTVETATAEIKGDRPAARTGVPGDQQRQRRHGAAAVRNAGQHGAADALRAARRGDDDAADRVREPRQPDAGSRGRPHAGNGRAPIARRRAVADRQADADRKPAARPSPAASPASRWPMRASTRSSRCCRRISRGFTSSRSIGACSLAAAIASIGTGVLFGLMPAIQAATGRSMTLLRSARVTGSGHAGAGTRRALLLAEVALALVLVTGAGLMLRTMGNLAAIDTGFTREQIITAQFNLPPRYDQTKRHAVPRSGAGAAARDPGRDERGVRLIRSPSRDRTGIRSSSSKGSRCPSAASCQARRGFRSARSTSTRWASAC